MPKKSKFLEEIMEDSKNFSPDKKINLSFVSTLEFNNRLESALNEINGILISNGKPKMSKSALVVRILEDFLDNFEENKG